MHIVAAGVHGARNFGGILQPGVLGDRQRVHVGASQDYRTLAIAQDTHYSGAADQLDSIAKIFKFLADPSRGFMFFQPQLGISVEMLVELFLP